MRGYRILLFKLMGKTARFRFGQGVYCFIETPVECREQFMDQMAQFVSITDRVEVTPEKKKFKRGEGDWIQVVEDQSRVTNVCQSLF